MASVVVFELNEVPWKVLDWWVAGHPRSALATLVGSSQGFVSVAPDEGHLSPWITWPTVHRGVPNTVHGIGHFGQDTATADSTAPPWWHTIAEQDRTVGVFGLLHTATLPPDLEHYAFFVPDTFAPTASTHPVSLEPFQAFNLAMARASARNVSTAIDRKGALRFLRAAPRLGLRPATVAALVRQLAEERVRPTVRVRRRSFQSVLAFDLFDRLLRDRTPDVAAFFTNHVASAMHRYWAATFPEDYPPDEFGFDEEWVHTWRDELGAALLRADRMVARLLRHSQRTGAVLVVASSMGQQAAQGTPVSRQLYLRDLGRLMAAAGIPSDSWETRPAMDPQVNFVVSEDVIEGFRSWLGSLTVGGRPVDAAEEAGGFFSLSLGQADDAIGAVTVDGIEHEPSTLGLEIVEIEDEAVSTGYHIPEGVLVVHDPSSSAPPSLDRPEVPTTAIAPFLHRLVGADVPAHHVDTGQVLLARS